MTGFMTEFISRMFVSAELEPPNIITILSHLFRNSGLGHTLHKYENLIFSYFAAICIAIIFIAGTRKLAMVPGKFQNLLEMVVSGLQDFFSGILGPRGKNYVPFLGTLFLYILFMDLMGLVPLLKSPTVDTNQTFALSFTVFFVVQYTAWTKLGPVNYIDHIAGQPRTAIMWGLCPFIFCILLLTDVFLPPMTLSIRLFGNITGEDTLIAAFLDLFSGYFSETFIPIPLHTIFMGLSLILGSVQALVFSMLSCVYVLMVLPHDEAH